ncbi:hypothetical protein FACS1894217_04760 [Clostridia bacterium]|nr:hypothetical protein FACS1894217_04760 [Clostridia bacterium]
MAQPKSEKRKLAFELWDKSGRTRTKKSLAEQLNTTEGTVFGWARTDRWKEQPPLSDKPKRKGGAPRGNTNALKHGAYARFKALTNEELKLFADILETDPVQAIKQTIAMLTIEEQRLSERIDTIENKYGATTLTSRENKDIVIQEGSGGAVRQETTHRQIAPFDALSRLRNDLRQTQRSKLKAAADIKHMEQDDRRASIEEQRLELMRSKLTGEFEIDAEIPLDSTENREEPEAAKPKTEG